MATKTDDPTNAPTTINPTVSPSSATAVPTQPTLSPTDQPTDYGVIIKYGLVITVTFDYKFGVNDTKTIESIIKDITNKLINETITAYCVESKDLNIHSKLAGNKTIVNATILVCNKDAQYKLLAAYDDNNITVEIINDIEKQIGLTIPRDTTSLQTDRIVITEESVYRWNNYRNKHHSKSQ